jgi:hypothetical protein
MNIKSLRHFALLAVLAVVLSMTMPAAADPATCTSGAHTLSKFGDRVYPEMGNGGYTSVHSDIYIVYDAATNMFLPGNHVDLTQQATQCLTDFSLDFERTSANVTSGPNMTVNSITVDGQPATFTFVQPTYPGDPNGQNDPDPLAHAVSNVNPVSVTNPNPPACSPQISGNSQNGQQCPANKLVITPSAPIPDGSTFIVTVNYTGRPGVYNDGDGTTEGWFRSNNPVGDGAFVTTEPVGTMAWMPLNNHPSSKLTVDVYDTVNAGKTAISAGELVSTQVNPPDANFPGGSVTWHWRSPERIASYLLTNSIGSFDLTQQTVDGIQYYWAVPSSISAARKAQDKVVTDQQPGITQFQAQFNGPFPFTSNGVVIGLPSASFAEEMQTKITFPNGASSTPSVGTLAHENMHQWFGDNVTEAAFNLTFWKEGWATVGEYLNTARTAANNAGGLGTPAGNAAFDNSLISRFNTNYGTTSSSAWTSAPSNPTVGNLFSTFSTYTRPGTAYLALRQILDSSASRPESDRWIGAMKQIQSQYGGGVINEPQLEAVFHQWLPNQSAGCSSKLDTFFTQWFDTAYPTPNNATNKPQITGPGINGPDHFYDDATACTRADQTITFGALPDKFTDDPDFNVSATSDSGLTISFAASGQCTTSGTTVHITGQGSCTITASQGGDGVFKPAESVYRTFGINKHSQTITFPAIPDHTYLDADFDPGATASSGLPVFYSASGNCTIASGLVHIAGAGSCTVTASQSGNENYNAAPDVSQSFNIAKANQTISFPPIANRTYGDADFDPGATASSSLAVSYSASGNCSIVSGKVNITGTGFCTVTASQAGNENYNPAPDISRTFSIAKAMLTVKPNPFTVSRQYSDPNPLFSPDITGYVNGEDASVLSTVPTCSSVPPTSAPGTYPITCTGGVATNYDFTYVNGTLTVTQEDADVTYAGDMLAFTASGGSTANVLLRATVLDSSLIASYADTAPGDIRNATVTFKEGATTLCGPLAVALINGAPTTGTASCTKSLGLGAHMIDVYVNNYYTGTTQGVVEVAQPSGNFITGGGFLRIGTSGGAYLADSGSKTNFGFNVNYKNIKNLQGHVNIIFRAGGHTYQIKSTAIDSLGITAKPSGGVADFRSKANLTDVTNPLVPVSLGGNLTLQVTLTDNGEPGSSDTIAFTLWSGDKLLFSSSWNGAKTVEQILGGGNLVVH